MNEGVPTLEAGFAITFGDSFVEVKSLDDLVGTVAADVIRNFAKVEAEAQGLLKLGGATARVKTFGSESTRELESAKQAANRVERAGEALSKQLDKQLSSFGRTREELRGMRVEAAALAAEQAGQTELATRLRAQEQALFDQEFAAMRRARQEAEALAEDRALAAAIAEQAAQREATALREAAFAHQMFEARVRSGATQMREEGLAAAADAVALGRLREMLDPAAAAQDRLNREMAEAARVMLAAGHSAEDVARAQEMLKLSMNNVTTSGGKAGYALTQLSFQLNDIITMGAMGAPPMQIFVSQFGQIVQVVQTAEGGLIGLARAAVAVVAPFAGLAAVGAAAAVGVIAWMQYFDAIERLNTAASGTGRLLGTTGDELERVAERAARAGDITIGAARDIVGAYAETGRIGLSILPGLTGATDDFARATGLKMEEARNALAAAFTDPAKGADELTQKYGLLDAATLAYVHDLVEQGRVTQAQGVLLKGLEGAFDGAAEHAGILARAWRGIEAAASDAWSSMGHAIDRALTGGTLMDQLASAQQERALLLVRNANANTSSVDAEIADLRRQLAAERNRQNNAAARSDAVKGMSIVDGFTGADKLGDLRTNLASVNRLLADNGRAAGLNAEQLRDARAAQDAYSRAVETFIPPAEKQQRIAALDAKIAAARSPAVKAALTAQREQLQLSGQVITRAQAEADARSKGAAALAQASRAGLNRADSLAREAQATEAQIKNIYQLADAYGVSGAAAIIAEARVKAESQAIKQQGDIQASVDRQIRLVVAQRVADGDKAAASMRDTSAAQRAVNDMVAAGLVPAERAAELVRDRLADLPLLNAIEVAHQRGLTLEVQAATRALNEQRAARDGLTAAESNGRLLASMRDGDNRLAQLREELRLIGATEAERTHALAVLRATQEAAAKGWQGERADAYIRQQVAIADGAQTLNSSQAQFNEALRVSADLANSLGNSLSNAFGRGGDALGEMISILGTYGAREEAIAKQVRDGQITSAAGIKYTRDLQMTSLIGMTSAAKGLFAEHSKGYRAMVAAEKVLTVVQLARTAVDVAGGAARMFATLGPYAFPAVAAMLGVMASLGFGGSGGTSSADYSKGNTGSGTVLGDSSAQSGSIKRSLDGLKEVNTATSVYAREMAASLRSIESNLGNLATLLVRTGNINASAGVSEGFQTNLLGKVLGGAPGALLGGAIGTIIAGPLGFIVGTTLGKVVEKIPVIGDIIGGINGVVRSLFGTKTSVIASGLYGDSQTVGDILAGGFDASYYSDVQKKKKFLGLTSSTKYSTEYAEADAGIEQQFGLLIRQFYETIGAASKPLGLALGDVEKRLSDFTIDLGKIDLQGLTGTEIQEKLEAVFGAAADKMADAAFPGVEKFQKVGEGAFETLVRVASTAEVVTTSLDRLGFATKTLGLDAKMAIADQFESVSAMASANDTYFSTFYSKAEQATARTAEFGRVFDSLGMAMPTTIAGFRSLVEAQDITTSAGQQAYATLIQLAPAFADLQTSLLGAKSAADIMSERADLERQLLEAQGDTAAIRALELGNLDASNRAIKQQIYALQDAKAAADAANQLRQAWASVGDSIMDEVRRIRGLAANDNGNVSFAGLMGQFNAATLAARGGDQDAAKLLPSLSKSLLDAAADNATSRQELERIRIQTAASLEDTNSAIQRLLGSPGSASAAVLANATAQASSPASAAEDALLAEVRALRAELAQLRSDNNAGHAKTANNTGSIDKRLDAVTQASSGNAISVEAA